MKPLTRRQLLKASLQTGLALSLPGCGGGGGGSSGGDGGNVGDPSGYKALVCIHLQGGNDGFNMIVPRTAEKYALYADARRAVALAADNLRPLDGTAADGAQYGAHPKLTRLAQLFNAGSAAVVCGVGSLQAPTSRADFLAGRNLPVRLFSHNDQRDQWASLVADGTGSEGWCGRVADVLPQANSGAILPMNLSLAGANPYQNGHLTRPLALLPRGPLRLASIGEHGALRSTFDALRALPRTHPFEREFVDLGVRAVRMQGALDDALTATPPPAVDFPLSALGDQLKLVAHIIAARARLGMHRQIFFVEQNTFDTHEVQLARHNTLYEMVDKAVDAFQQALAALGVADRVVSFTASDFGRSLSVNGDGTDHGWSSHHWVIGNAVRGGAFYGQMPSLEVGGADDTLSGRFIPSSAVDEYVAPLARWFGVPAGDIGYVLPRLGRFDTPGLPLFG